MTAKAKILARIAPYIFKLSTLANTTFNPNFETVPIAMLLIGL